MVARKASSTSEDILSDESDLNVLNLYDSDLENLVKRFEESGPLPYRFEPRRVRQNVEEDGRRRQRRQRQKSSMKHRPVFNLFRGLFAFGSTPE